MQWRRRDTDGATLVALDGSFDSVSLPEVRGLLAELTGEGRLRLCLNMRDVSFINSTALGYLVALRKQLAESGGDLVFSQPSEFFSATFRTLELHHIFQMFDADAEALASLDA